MAAGDCGSTLLATLQLSDGAAPLHPVTFSFTLGVQGAGGAYTCCFTPTSVGDFDGDGDNDQSDFGFFQACLGPNQQVAPPECQAGRLDADVDVDQADLVIFRRCHTQPGVIPAANCRTAP